MHTRRNIHIGSGHNKIPSKLLCGYSHIGRPTSTNLQLLLDGLPELSHPGLDAVGELGVVPVKVPQKAGQRLCGTKRNW